MLIEGKQIHNFISSSGSGTVINYGSGSDFSTSYGSGSTSQKVPVPTVPVPVPQRCLVLGLHQAESLPVDELDLDLVEGELARPVRDLVHVVGDKDGVDWAPLPRATDDVGRRPVHFLVARFSSKLKITDLWRLKGLSQGELPTSVSDPVPKRGQWIRLWIQAGQNGPPPPKKNKEILCLKRSLERQRILLESESPFKEEAKEEIYSMYRVWPSLNAFLSQKPWSAFGWGFGLDLGSANPGSLFHNREKQRIWIRNTAADNEYISTLHNLTIKQIVFQNYYWRTWNINKEPAIYKNIWNIFMEKCKTWISWTGYLIVLRDIHPWEDSWRYEERGGSVEPAGGDQPVYVHLVVDGDQPALTLSLFLHRQVLKVAHVGEPMKKKSTKRINTRIRCCHAFLLPPHTNLDENTCSRWRPRPLLGWCVYTLASGDPHPLAFSFSSRAPEMLQTMKNNLKVRFLRDRFIINTVLLTGMWTETKCFIQCCGSPLIWLSWIRIGNADPDPDLDLRARKFTQIYK